EKKIAEIKIRPADKMPADTTRSEQMKQIDAKADDILSKPRENKDQLKQRIKEISDLQDQMKAQQDKLAEKNDAVGQQLKKLDDVLNKDKSPDGPAKDMQKALSEGNMDKVKKEAEELSKKLKNNELSKEQKDQLGKQMKDMQEKLERLSRNKDKQEE